MITDVPDFSGVWVEPNPVVGPPMHLQLIQSGSKVQVRVSYRVTFSGSIAGVGIIENGTATWTLPQGCIGRFQWPGYNYDNPGVNKVSLSLRDPAEPGQPGRLLVFVQEIQWNAPCANHQIGTERIQRTLKRQ